MNNRTKLHKSSFIDLKTNNKLHGFIAWSRVISFQIIFVFFLCTLTKAQIVIIPDPNFKNALLNTICADSDNDGLVDIDADFNNDGEIQSSEAQSIYGLSIHSQNISDLTGIESFINLKILFCNNNQLTNINISQNTNLVILGC